VVAGVKLSLENHKPEDINTRHYDSPGSLIIENVLSPLQFEAELVMYYAAHGDEIGLCI